MFTKYVHVAVNLIATEEWNRKCSLWIDKAPSDSRPLRERDLSGRTVMCGRRTCSCGINISVSHRKGKHKFDRSALYCRRSPSKLYVCHHTIFIQCSLNNPLSWITIRFVVWWRCPSAHNVKQLIEVVCTELQVCSAYMYTQEEQGWLHHDLGGALLNIKI